jgi:Fe2+ or Zn2+ uptake regulation protein
MSRQTRANHYPLKELSLDAIVGLLRANGMRITKNRIQIIDTLLRAEKPLSLDEIQS